MGSEAGDLLIGSARVVVRTYHPEVPPRVEYEISELGRSLAPIFAQRAEWSAENLPKVDRARREFDAG